MAGTMGPGTGGAAVAVAPPTLRPRVRRPSKFDEKMYFKNTSEVFFFLFGIDTFKIKWPKSEEKLEFGCR